MAKRYYSTFWRRRSWAFILAGGVWLLTLIFGVDTIQAGSGKGKGGYGCQQLDQATINELSPGDTIMVVDVETSSPGPVTINKNNLTIQGGWRPINADDTDNCGGGEDRVYNFDTGEQFQYFDFDPSRINGLPNSTGPVFIIDPTITDLRIEHIRFHDNDAAPVITGEIGNGADVYLDNLIFENNSGGGLDLVVRNNSRLFISNSQFLDNRAGDGSQATGFTGFRIYVYDTSQVIIDNVYVAGNVARGTHPTLHRKNGGGAFIEARGNSRVTVSNSSFIDNQAESKGGGLALAGDSSAKIQLINIIFADNKTDNIGAAINVNGPRVDIIHSTVAGSSLNPKQGIYVESGIVQVTNSIIVRYNIGLQRNGGTVSQDYNLFYNNTTHRAGSITSGGHSIDDLSPNFESPNADNYHIGPNSAALNKGTNAGITGDIDGDARPGGLAPDMGADERAFNKVGPATASVNSQINYTLTLDHAGPRTTTSSSPKDQAINLPSGLSSGLATPYPSSLTVSGMTGVVTEVKVTLHDISFSDPSQVDMLLVGPNGQGVVLMSDATYNDFDAPDPLSLGFDDNASANLPSNTSTPVEPRIYQPTNYGTGDTFSSPAPGGPYNTSLSVFDDIDPNGTWRLFVVDDSTQGNNFGSIGGWTLHLTTKTNEQISVSDPLPSGAGFISATGSGWSCSQNAGQVNCTRTASNSIKPVPAINLALTAPANPGDITNSATVASNLPGLTAQTANAVTTIQGGGNPIGDLSISKSGPATAQPGGLITYILTVSNNGEAEEYDILISDTIPTGATYMNGGTKVGNQIQWSIPSLAGNGATAQVNFVVTAEQTIINSDYAASSSSGTSAIGSVAVVTTIDPDEPPPPPTASLSISKSGPATAQPGGLITYILTVANSGDTAIQNLVISDTIPVGATYVSGGTKVGDQVQWFIPSLASSVIPSQVSFVVTATQTITNSDYAASNPTGVNAKGSTAVVTSIDSNQAPPATPSLSLSKSGPTTALANSPIEYILTVANAGGAAAQELIIFDTIPAGATYVSGGTKVDNQVQWSIPSLAGNGATAQVSFVVMATENIVNNEYSVSSSSDAGATGSTEVFTLVTGTASGANGSVFLPILFKN